MSNDSLEIIFVFCGEYSFSIQEHQAKIIFFLKWRISFCGCAISRKVIGETEREKMYALIIS